MSTNNRKSEHKFKIKVKSENKKKFNDFRQK